MIPEGLRTALNNIRETSIVDSTLYSRYVEEITPNTNIGEWSAPILDNQTIMNEFCNKLVQRIVKTQVELRLFNNPLQVLEGADMILGSLGQEIFINPIVGRRFNVDDFAGLLAKYEIDCKVEYHHLNSDIQYPVTITRAKIKDAFVSWESLNAFIEGTTNALYNGAYIDRYDMTKDLVASAYAGNNVQIEVISAITSEATGKAFLEKARGMFLNFQTPTSDFNAWAKVGGYGREILTFTPKNDIVILLRNDVLATLDVNVLASAFNIDKADLLGNVIGVNNFDVYEYQKQTDGSTIRVKTYDGSKIIGMICDKRWFKVWSQELTMDEWYNPNNRCWQYYLNDVRGYSYSLFANAVVFATEEPTVTATKIEFTDDTAFSIEEGQSVIRTVVLTPFNSTSSVTFTSADSTKVKVTKIDNRHVKIEGASADASPVTITATCETSLTDTISVTCVAGT